MSETRRGKAPVDRSWLGALASPQVSAASDSEFVRRVIAIVDEARATPMIERRGRLVDRARQYIASLIYSEAGWYRSEPHPRRHELTDEERDALRALDLAAWVLTPASPIVHLPRQSMHRSIRIAKRWQKRNARRDARREGVAALRAVLSDDDG